MGVLVPMQEMAIWNLDHGEEAVLGPRSLAFVHGCWEHQGSCQLEAKREFHERDRGQRF